ncbi:MAG: replication-associated recombination protein A [Deltaproteobacteria bacterium]|nr:replication-associated recombination protein A [Deltaproteobacteria bacterium]
MRPEILSEFVGQKHLTDENAYLKNAITQDKISSMILWGPPGCGKTTLANIIESNTKECFLKISAVLSGVKDIREVIEKAQDNLNLHRKRTILFVDEIHRFNKSQQDAFLYHVESGLITLIGATTENPSFEVIPALISRCRIITFNPLSEPEMVKILSRAVSDSECGVGNLNLVFDEDALKHLIKLSDGDVRTALNNVELTAFQAKTFDKNESGKIEVALSDIEKILEKKAMLYDKTGEAHYNLISAFHKSLRGSDPDAAIYWLFRMLEGGEDPFYIIRRMVRFASEDVGLADPNALRVALNSLESFKFLGFPEGEQALADAAIYLATAPKSNSVYMACKRVKEEIKNSGNLQVPMHIRNAPTKMMRDTGYGKGYKYAHDYKGGYVPQDYLPEEIKKTRFYLPTGRGYEKIVKQRLDKWINLKKDLEKSDNL